MTPSKTTDKVAAPATPSEIIDKAVDLMNRHLDQIKVYATQTTEKGPRGFGPADSQVIERYTKLLLVMTKQTDAQDDNLSGLSDDQLLALLNESNSDVSNTSSD